MKTYLPYRQIDYFDKFSERIRGEIEIEYIDLEKIKNRFPIPLNDPLVYNCYQIDSDKVDLFPSVQFDFNRYDYFLVCYSDYLIRTNKKMQYYLERLGYDYRDTRINLPFDLEKIVNKSFLTTNDCVTLKGFGHRINPIFETEFEKCDWEYRETHFHPDSFSKGDDEIEFLRLALECGKQLSKRLSKRFKKEKFRILISFMETLLLNNKVEVYGSSTVRFYKIRQDAEDEIYVNDLDVYDNAVMEFEKM